MKAIEEKEPRLVGLRCLLMLPALLLWVVSFTPMGLMSFLPDRGRSLLDSSMAL
ncbi:hypothetical protein N9F48_00820 [Akkermansiaceae bacterium]|nr:hypothetical protein [Akkermansiaceae bacterium]MDA7898566.1 hypothetical protein [bacterium]MDA7519166.1 hypothetical protein [Akkermansiaceae bacterium]MDA7629800.1 hypothetical protein [Akkermansiaceae bacterium]MDA7684343.1 hypothetical protein [Akkermansiaceae bacterium]